MLSICYDVLKYSCEYAYLKLLVGSVVYIALACFCLWKKKEVTRHVALRCAALQKTIDLKEDDQAI